MKFKKKNTRKSSSTNGEPNQRSQFRHLLPARGVLLFVLLSHRFPRERKRILANLQGHIFYI